MRLVFIFHQKLGRLELLSRWANRILQLNYQYAVLLNRVPIISLTDWLHKFSVVVSTLSGRNIQGTDDERRHRQLPRLELTERALCYWSCRYHGLWTGGVDAKLYTYLVKNPLLTLLITRICELPFHSVSQEQFETILMSVARRI